MSDYTPTTEEVFQSWKAGVEEWEGVCDRAEFYSWLNAHDAEVRRLAFMEIVNGTSLPDDCVAAIRADERERAAQRADKLLGLWVQIASFDPITAGHILAAIRGDGSHE